MNLLEVQALLAHLGVPILLPEERETPLAGRKPGQPGGLSAYLKTHSGGYVQLYDATGLISDTLFDTGTMRLEAVALDRQTAEALSDQVRGLIGGLDVAPTPYRVFIPPSTIVQDGFVRVVTTYQTRSTGV